MERAGQSTNTHHIYLDIYHIYLEIYDTIFEAVNYY